MRARLCIQFILGVNAILIFLTRQNKRRWRVDGKVELLDNFDDVPKRNSFVDVGQRRCLGDGFQSGWELSNVCRIIKLFDVFSASSDSHRVKHLEKVETQRLQQLFGRPCFQRQVYPFIVSPLRLTENLIDGFFRFQQRVDFGSIAFVSQLQLVFQVIKAVIDRRSREHQHLGLHACLDYLVHQAEIAVFLWVFIILCSSYLASVSEVVAFVDDHKVVVAPVDVIQLHPVRHT